MINLAAATPVRPRHTPLAPIIDMVDVVTSRLNTWGVPVLQLGMRLWMAKVFFTSGLTKVQDWDTTVLLFADEYKVPLLPPEAAATLGTTFELGMPVLL